MSTLKEFSDSLIFPLGDKLPEQFSKFFIGQAHLNMLTTTGVSIGNVTFEPACRNNWHIHHKGGQILLVTAGEGYYQEWGKPAQKLKAGDVVNIPAEVKHWHSATKDSFFSHHAAAHLSPESAFLSVLPLHKNLLQTYGMRPVP